MRTEYIQQYPIEQQAIIINMEKRIFHENEITEKQIMKIKQAEETVFYPDTTELEKLNLTIYKDEHMQDDEIGICKTAKIKIDKYSKGELIINPIKEEDIYERELKIILTFNRKGTYQGVTLRTKQNERIQLPHIGMNTACIGTDTKLQDCENNPENIEKFINEIIELQRTINLVSILGSFSRMDTKLQKLISKLSKEINIYICPQCGQEHEEPKDAETCCIQTDEKEEW